MADLNPSQTILAPSLKALLGESIDYAGTFPPAALTIDEAVENYAKYLRSDEAWMLGGFVYPAARLEELTPFRSLLAEDPPFRFSVLAGESGQPDRFLQVFRRHLDGISQFRDDLDDHVSVASIETFVPRALLSTDVITIRRFADDIASALDRRGLQPVDLFFEIPLDENVRQTLPLVTGALHGFNRERSIDGRGRSGIKMRTGGPEADVVPSLESVAFLISTCRTAGVRFKATAGLHHPVRHFGPTVGAEMHGFLNVFAAAVFSWTDAFGEDLLVEILSDEEASSFSFDDDALLWKGRRAGVEAIKGARRNVMASFGSCSFDEPVEDLRSLGLIQ